MGRAAIKTINAARKLPSINKTKFLFINQKTYFVCLSFLFAKLAISKAMRHKKRSLLLYFSFTKHFYKKRQQNSRFFLNFATWYFLDNYFFRISTSLVKTSLEWKLSIKQTSAILCHGLQAPSRRWCSQLPWACASHRVEAKRRISGLSWACHNVLIKTANSYEELRTLQWGVERNSKSASSFTTGYCAI